MNYWSQIKAKEGSYVYAVIQNWVVTVDYIVLEPTQTLKKIDLIYNFYLSDETN